MRPIAIVLLALSSLSALAQDDAMSVLYDRHLKITSDGLLDTKKRVLVLDLSSLQASTERAREYFEVRKLTQGRPVCGPRNELSFYPHYELSKAGRVYACVQIKSLPPLPSADGVFWGGVLHTSNIILFVGPVCDRAGGCPGMLLTEIPQFVPLRDCNMVEGMVTCNPKGVNVYYDVHSCNRDLAKAPDERELFKRKRGKFSLCSIDLIQAAPN